MTDGRDNLRRLYKTLQDNGYNPPAYEQFEKDMEDENNLRGVYSTLQKEGYTPPAFDQFRSDMGYNISPSTPSAGIQNAAPRQNERRREANRQPASPEVEARIKAQAAAPAQPKSTAQEQLEETRAKISHISTTKQDTQQPQGPRVPRTLTPEEQREADRINAKAAAPRAPMSSYEQQVEERRRRQEVGKYDKQSQPYDISKGLGYNYNTGEGYNPEIREEPSTGNNSLSNEQVKDRQELDAPLQERFRSNVLGILNEPEMKDALERAAEEVWKESKERAYREEDYSLSNDIAKTARTRNASPSVNKDYLYEKFIKGRNNHAGDKTVGMDLERRIYEELVKRYPSELYPEVSNSMLHKEAENIVMNLMYETMYNKLYEERKPRNGFEFVVDKALSSTVPVMLMDASNRIATNGQYLDVQAAQQKAIDDYSENHWLLDKIGIVGGFVLDPTTYVGGFLGKGAVKGLTNIAGNKFGRVAAEEFAQRRIGKYLEGAINSGVSLGFINTAQEAANQARWGGVFEGYDENGAPIISNTSVGRVVTSGLEGLGLGSVTGMTGGWLRNVGTKYARLTDNVAGKGLIHGTSEAMNVLTSGTIFEIPQAVRTWLQYDEMIASLSDPNSENYIADAAQRSKKIEELKEKRGEDIFDEWGENVATMAAFHIEGKFKTAPQRLREMAGRTGDRAFDRAGFASRMKMMLDGREPNLALTKDEKEELDRRGYTDLNGLVDEYKKYVENGESGEGADIPYNMFIELMQDRNVSEAARAKMYYYVTGRILPMSTIMGSSPIEEVKDASGKVTGYRVKSFGANGIITSRTFGSEREARMEQQRIDRQVELNSAYIGEQFFDKKEYDRMMKDACDVVGERKGMTGESLYNMLQRDPSQRSAVEAEWAKEIENEMLLLDKDNYGSKSLRKYLNEKYEVDIDKVIGKEPNRRSENEKIALHEYYESLFKDVEQKADTPFDRGHEAREEERRDIVLELAAVEPGSEVYEERKEAWDGVRQKIEEDADYQVAQQREVISKMTDKSDGSLRPAILKEKNEDGSDKEVYIVDGAIQMTDDGSMVDKEKSSSVIYYYDLSDGKIHNADPSDFMSVGEVKTADVVDGELQKFREWYVQDQIDKAQGVVNVQPGDQFTMPDGSVATVQDNDGETITFVQADGTPTSMPVAEVQRIADELAMVDYQQRHSDAGSTGDAGTGIVKGAPAEFIPDMEITVNDNGEEKPAIVMGRVKLEGKQYVPDENGAIVEYMMDGDVKHDHIDKLAGKTVSYVEATPAVVPTEEAEAMPQPTEGTPQAEPVGTVEAVGGEGATEVHDDPMPMREDGEADFMATTPERGHQYIYNEAGLSREEAGEFVKANIDAATKELEGLKKKAPKMGTSLVKYKQQQAEHQAKVDAAQQAVDYWQGVKATQSAIVSAEMAEQAERDRVAHEAAVLAEQQRQADEIAKREEQAALGSNAVAPQIVEKWAASPKVEGVENEITLANGEKVKGHYMLVESGAATPSHNPNMEFARNEGFPIDENGQTVNDRDYERDQEAQLITRQMADSYDSRAIQNVPVVSQDGIVLSGNGRTMAGELAAQQGTDGAYIEHLKKYPQQFGFTPEQVEGMQHPRVVFVADEDMPYTTDTFAKFNQQDMKSQSRTEQSVKMGKTVDDNTFGRIIRSINGFDSLADFYNDPVAATNAIGELHSAGAINTMQLAEMMDGEKVSGNGRQMLENMLIGKAFESNPDAIRQLAEFPAMRQSVVSALAEIANNIHLGEEYSLEGELAQAINLAYQARKNGTKAGDKVSWFARQQSLFPFDTGETVADYTNATVLMLADELNSASVNGLKKCLALYNRNASEAAAGQYDIFSGGIKSKQDIINDALNVLNYGTEQEQQAALAAAVEQRKQGIQQDGVAGPGDAGSGVERNREDNVQPPLSSDAEVEELLARMSDIAEVMPNTTLTPETWMQTFGINNSLSTPIGNVKMGENQYNKLVEKQRTNEFGMVVRTLQSPDVILVETSESVDGAVERSTSYVFVKTFIKEDGTKVVRYESVTVSQDGMEVSISSHRLRENQLREKLKRDGLLYKATALDAPANTSAEQPTNGGSLSSETDAETEPQQPNDAVSSGSSLSTGEEGGITPAEPNGEPTVSGSKDTNISETDKEKVASAIESAESEVNTNPTEGQKEAGNYKKGHLKLDGYDITIEQPKGSIRRGTDDNGKAWEQEMHNTYGYIRGTEGVDGDHIDVFLSDDPTSGDVFVVDQVDQMGIFDEHKVMYGFPDMESAKAAYLSNYEEGWQGLGAITPVSKEEFKKWIESSHRKTKPFAEYASVKALGDTELPSMTAEQQAIGDAMVYQLESMGFEVSTDISENRRVHKEAEKDNSEAGKLRHYKTTDGKVYGFSYKGKMYLDPRRINADLPLHEYAHLWCEALGKLNPEGWKGVVDLMKGDAETWNLVKQLVPDLTDENDIAAEMIARYSSRNGAERAKAEYERMNAGGNFGNIWQNIAKAIQDFWRQVGDFLNIKYKSVEQVYDQVVKDFANRINPRRRVEEWLAERDEAYMQAVESGDAAKAKELFDAALRENVGNGITPFIAVDGYRGKMDRLAREVKSRDPKVIAEVAELLSPLVPTDAVLVPAPSHSGEATDMLDVANAIAERTGTPVADVLKGDARESQHEAKKENGQPIAASQLGITMNGELPEGKLPVVIDNVVDSGNTAEACVQALGKGVVVSLSEAVDRYDHVVSLKSAAPVVHDKSGAVVPLSKRFELGGSRYLDKAHANDEAPLSLKEMAEASDDVALEMQHAEQRGAEDNDGKNANEMHEEEQPKEETKKSKWVDEEDAERFEALRRRMRELKGHLNMGVNPEQLAIGVEMSYYVIKHGARKFGEYAKQMIDALGEWVRPYLKSFYNGARDLPDMAGLEKELTPYDEVRAFDVMNFDKEGPKDIIAMAEHIVKERDAEKQAVEATAKLKKQRNAKRKKMPVTEGPNLFSGIEDAEPKGTATEQPKEEKPINNNSHETTDVQPRTSEEGREGHELKQNGAVGEGAGDEAARPDGGGVAGRDTAHPGTDGVGSEGVSGEVESEQGVEQPKRNLNNNHAERGTDYAPKDVDKRIAANIAAIEKMQELMESGQQATPEDMAVLRKFSGWGGLGKAFQETGYGYGYDPTKTSKRLKALLGDEAYEQANMSRNSAYYTPAKVIDALWDIANTMGFKGGKVLEGSAGIGNILGLMPQEMSEKSDIHAVEIDSTTGNILKLLYPDAKVDVQGFEVTEVENGSVDLAITNVPFVTGLRVNDTTGDKDLSKKFHDIHDFCIAKNVRKLREGGVGIFITSSGTMDNSTKLREWIVQEGGADVVGAFRMNNETFGGTGATSDIIVIRKRVNGKKSAHAIDVLTTFGARTVEYDTGDTKKVKGEYIPIVKQMSLDYNKYFIEHPEMMGGEMGFAFEHGDTYRATSKGLYPKKGINQDERLAAFVKSMEGFDDEANQPTESAGAVDNVYAELGDGVKEGSMIVRDGKLCVAQRGRAVPLMSAPKKGEKVSEEELVARFHKNKVRGHTKAECLQSYQDIKDALSAVLEYQTENEGDEGLQPLLDALNNAYDQFVDTYGHLHRNNPIAFLKNDVDFANILALERFSERGDKKGNKLQEFGKTDIFSQRVVEKEKAPEPTNTKDGIIASIYVHGRVDVPWIAATLSQHAGHEVTEAQVKDEIIKAGLGFENPASRQVEVSYEYLSGNVREKLAQAQQNNTDGRYDANIKALEDVIPMNIPSHLIDFSIGSSWIDPKLYEDYVKERTDIDVTFTPVSGTWYMKKPGFLNEEKNRSFGIVSQMFGKTIMGTELIEAAMTNKTITVSETRRTWDGKTVTETDKDATTACANKIDEIRQDFKEWARGRMRSDPAMSEHIEKVYNEMFNNYVPKSIPDEFVPEHFGGAATMVDGRPFSLRPHQGKAAVRATTQPLLLAHEVGTGKTYTLITTAMEMRRLGTARKPMIVVQNSTVGQFVESAKKLYPNAKVLTLEDKDHTAEGRKNFYAKIKYNDWDMIVVPQSVFERIPDSEERQSAFVKDKIEEKEKALEQMRDADPDGNSMIVKQAEREIEKLEEELAALTTQHEERRKERDAKREAVVRQNAEIKALEMLDRQTDDVENFDDMGIDALLVDEAHEYKHLGFATAMQRGVKGIDPSFSKKAQGVYLKTQAVMEKNNGRNVVFATGTPISNTAAEIWTFMRYLMPADTMREYDIYYFDDFVRNFGNLTQMLEFTTSGKFKENNRFAGYVNLPELVRIWSGVADTVLTAEAGGVSDKIPDMEGGKAKDIYLPQTKALRSVMKYVKSELERFENMTGKQKKENSYIPLTMYGIAKAAAVDARLVVVDATDDEHSKTNEAVRQTLKSLEETKSYKGAVAIFADNYQNKRSGFNLYEDIREKLVAAGVPEEQIIVMKSGMSVKKKLEIFDMVNRGDVRVIMGSTFTLGTGVNIQERLHTLIHVDAPNRPMDYTQRNGRILRQGNLHKDMGLPVRVLRFGVEDSLDVTAYQRLKTKGAIADSIMNGKQMMSNSMENRVLEEEEDVFGDTIAQLSGSEYAMLKNQAEKDVRKYENKKKQWEADQTYCHNEIPRLESKIRQAQIRLDEVKKALDKVVAMASQHTEPTIIVDNKQFASIDAMADFIKEFNKKIRETESEMRENPYDKPERSLTMKVNVGGFDFIFTTAMSSETTSKQGTLFSAVHRKMSYSCEALGLEDIPVRQSLLREGMEDIVQNVITGNDFRERIENLERGIEKNKGALAQVRERDGKPFGYIKELEAAHKHLDEYTELMKKEMEEKEKKYAEMDADVEEAVDVVEAEEAGEEDGEDEDVRMRDGVGDQTIEVSYEESLANSRAAGYTKKQHDAMIARRWEQRIATAQEYAKRLGLDGRVNVVLSADEIENISERKKKAKGWYGTKSGKIVVVLYNHSSMDDVAKTLLHEGVAHYGLRELFGKRFDQFLTNVYEHSDEGIRREIAELAKDHGWDFRTATEEYLARMAEDMDFEKPERQSWWANVKTWFFDMLHKIGLQVKDWYDTLTDNELRYILWRSYKNLTEPGYFRSLAEDTVMQSKLKVGQFEEETTPRSETTGTGEDIPMAAEPKGEKSLEEIKKKYPGVVFLTKIGDIYKASGKDAHLLKEVCGLHEDDGGNVWFGKEDIEKHLPRLVRAGHRVAIAEDIDIHDDGTRFRDGEETDDIWSSQSMGIKERITAAATRLSANHAGDKKLKNDAVRAIGGNLSDLIKAMSLQKEYDKGTVKRVVDLSRVLVREGYIDNMSANEVSRLLSAAKNATGKGDITGSVKKVMDIMIDNQLRRASDTLHSLESIKASKVDSKGVEVQGQLDVAGQQMMRTFKETRGWSEKELEDAIAEQMNRMGSSDAAIAEQAANEYAGLQFALEYVQNIKASKSEERELRQDLEGIKPEWNNFGNGQFANRDAYLDFKENVENAIRENHVDRLQAYTDLIGKLTGSLRESIANAQAFKEAEKERVREIQHNANSDMEGRPSDEHGRADNLMKSLNNVAANTLFAPLGTFVEMMRLFGSKSSNGEGYLFNRFVRGLIDARQKEIRGVRSKYAVLDAKVQELFGNDCKNMAGLIRLTGKMPKLMVEFWDGGEMKQHKLTQGNMMYIYMVNKMLDGRIKLRKMGVDEKAMRTIMQTLDQRLIDLADWMQGEFLVDTRNEYNETHKRMFGASMAAIEDYFPLKILANARADNPEELDAPDYGKGISTKTGSIIKRRRNTLALDLTRADALNVILDHVAQMEHWNAFAEYNRDLNTLRTYKHFRNQVQNMTTVYGNGKKLWDNFNDVCQMAVGSYRPRQGKLDRGAIEVARGVTAAKVSFRINTALKQLLSIPAYIPYINAQGFFGSIASNMHDKNTSFAWCLENLPMFEERWKSRVSGDPKLAKSVMDWQSGRANWVQKIARGGMLPNAFVDALTVSIGAHAVYETRKAQYLKDGYSEEKAERRAIQDAEIAYNETQQSSEGGFTSTMQADHTWLSTMFSVFRNASMSYTRRLSDAIRNIGNNITSDQRKATVEFEAKRLVRDGVDESKAERSAKSKLHRDMRKNWLAIATFGFIVQFAWNFGGKMWYLLFGDDDDEKSKMWDDIFAQALFGSVEGLTGGDVMSEFGRQWVTGDWNPKALDKDMPLSSDVATLIQKACQGKGGDAINDMVNLIVQSGLGMNPQSITDIVIAIMDACGDDPALAHEATIFVSRVMQVPQSQIDKMYFDEVGLSGSEVSKYTPEQLARRYAEYKVKRGHFVTPWNWGDEELIAKQEKKADKAIKERVGRLGNKEVNDAYLEYEGVYNDISGKMKAAKAAVKTDYMEAARLFGEAQSDRRRYATYNAFKNMDKGLKKLVELYLGAKNEEEAALCHQAIIDYKAAMVEMLNNGEDNGEITAVTKPFMEKYQAMQEK